jgi:hypothetical protein
MWERALHLLELDLLRGRLCSRVACRAVGQSAAPTPAAGPLMDGLTDFTCPPPQMCLQGMCK